MESQHFLFSALTFGSTSIDNHVGTKYPVSGQKTSLVCDIMARLILYLVVGGVQNNMAPTPGYEDAYFTSVTTKDTVAIKHAVQTLACKVKTPSWKQVSFLLKTMTNIKSSYIQEPVCPVRIYVSGNGADLVETHT